MIGSGCKSSKCNVEEEYKIIKQLGTGSFGNVYLVESISGEKFAMKEIITENKIIVQNEIKFMKMLDNQFIVKFYESLPIDTVNPIKLLSPYSLDEINKITDIQVRMDKIMEETQNLPPKYIYKLILEYCKGGDLLEYLDYHFTLDESTRITNTRTILYQLLTGTKYLHDIGVIHRDLKLENILLKDKDNINCIKITDFGLSIKYSNKGKLITKCCNGIKGTLDYIAPEVFTANNDEKDLKHKYNEKCDMWSIGIILYVLVIDDYPTWDNRILIKMVKKKNYSSIDDFIKKHFYVDFNKFDIPSDIKALLENLIKINKDKRWNCTQCLESDFFADYDSRIHENCDN